VSLPQRAHEPQPQGLPHATEILGSIGIKKDNKKEDPKGDDKDEGFPEIHECFMIYGGPSTRLST
jgi:hypothetical protein